ncbi:MAG: PqqD family protein [Xanthobacteraceae bacterium]
MYYTTKVPKLVSRQFDDEVILANFETGLYYSLMGTAADIWLGIESGVAIEEIVAAFASTGEQQTVDAHQLVITSFVDKLLTENIIAPHAGTPDRKPWALQFSAPFSEPTLDQFDDLRDLLFLDPVHDVSEAGWPMKAADDV